MDRFIRLITACSIGIVMVGAWFLFWILYDLFATDEERRLPEIITEL